MAETDLVTLAHADRPGERWTIPASMLPVHDGTGWYEVPDDDDPTDGDDREIVPAPVEIPFVADAPHRNASKADWHDYALSQGADPLEIADLSRDELRDRYIPLEG